jgi:hypothetical protein
VSAVEAVIGIHGAPRSGTSWLGQLFNSHPEVKYCYQPFFSYAFRGRATTASSRDELEALFRDMRVSDDEFVNQAGSARLASSAPRFSKHSHACLIYKEVRFHDLLPHILSVVPGFKAIGIVRDPRYALASWFKAPREFDPAWSPLWEWRDAPLKNRGLEENWYGFSRWCELARMFLRLQVEYPHRFRLVRYEDLVADTVATIRGLLGFCGLDLPAQVRQFADASVQFDDADPYGVFRSGRAAALASGPFGLDRDIDEAILRELAGTPLQEFLVGGA